MEEKEIWKDVVGFEGLWQMEIVSRLIESARIDGDKIVINADW